MQPPAYNLLKEKVAQLPLLPGVYLYKDAAGKVIYVGKAKSLRLRVRNYFSEDKLAERKTGGLMAEARDVDYILVDNEKEALLVSPRDPAAFAAAMRRYLQDPELARQHGAAAGHRAAQAYAIENTLAKLYTLYDQVLSA